MEFGYTETEAQFLYIVATHSGYFTLRQFLKFTGAHRGKRSPQFARKVLNNGHASMRDYMGYGSIYHLFSRTLYGQIEKGNLRNRRKHSFEFIRTRLVLLDFVLAHRTFTISRPKKRRSPTSAKSCASQKSFSRRGSMKGLPAANRPFAISWINSRCFLLPPLLLSPSVVTLSYVDSGARKRLRISHAPRGLSAFVPPALVPLPLYIA